MICNGKINTKQVIFKKKIITVCSHCCLYCKNLLKFIEFLTKSFIFKDLYWILLRKVCWREPVGTEDFRPVYLYLP